MAVHAMRIAPGYYWTVGGFEILHDNGEGGTGHWVVMRRGPGGTGHWVVMRRGPGGTGHWVVMRRGPGAADNPLAFCGTLREACGYIAALLGR